MTGSSLSGEERLKQRRSRFYRYSALGIAVAVLFGMVSGYTRRWYESGLLPGAAIVAMWALGLGAFGFYVAGYLRRLDEVDMADNLWAAYWGFHFYMVAYPTWYFFATVGMMPDPNQQIIWFTTMLVMLVGYVTRKLGLR
ncbi:hypothetical protein [Aurantiacibacter luteus]|uniref:Uncharacterized protein n=1 Tax=Aurantiacibacter luteus TaxID=1581420 RepID=A0A0G9MXN7_9SPHN|nr:hypothetical protein [Aurantiacibacter luteus]KLE35501.1 hypothetical protein AAW00_03490 [Aurantiacibacter luteus]